MTILAQVALGPVTAGLGGSRILTCVLVRLTTPEQIEGSGQRAAGWREKIPKTDQS